MKTGRCFPGPLATPEQRRGAFHAIQAEGPAWAGIGGRVGRCLGRRRGRAGRRFTVAGTSYTLGSGLRSAFVHDTAGMTNLGHLGGDYLEVVAINDRGTVVGTGDPGVTAEGLNVSRAYASIAGQVTALQGSALTHSFATGLNNHDEIVGGLRTPSNSEEHAFVALPDLRWGIPTVFDIHRRVSLGGPNSAASAINDRGDIVGWVDVASGQTRHAFLLPSAGGVVRDLGTLGGNSSAAHEVNALGQVLGESTLADGTLGWFVYRDGRMLNLAGSLAGVYGVLGEPTVLFATLSDAGHVAGTVRTAEGQIRSFLLSPVPEPQTATLLLLGLAALRRAFSRHNRSAARHPPRSFKLRMTASLCLCRIGHPLEVLHDIESKPSA